MRAGSSSRRRLVRGALALAALPGLVQAAAFPSHPIRIIVGFGAGGLADFTIRLVGEQLSRRLGQQVVVDNRPGAGGTLAARAAASGEPDGHTLTVLSTGNAINATLFRSLPYDPLRDFAAISGMGGFDLLLLTGADSTVHGLADIRGRRAPIVIATISPGSTQNLAGEWLRVALGLDATITPYRSTPEVLTALQRGDAELGFESFSAARGMLEAGRVRAIAGTGEHRAPWLPAIPTLRELGVADYVVTGWNALFAPAATPGDAIARLNQDVVAILGTPEVRDALLARGVEPMPTSPAAMAALLRRDVALWAEVIRRAGIPLQ